MPNNLYKIEVEIPTDTEDECAKYEPCRYLLNSYCALFGGSVTVYNGHTYKLCACPASGEKRYDESTEEQQRRRARAI